MKRPHPLFGVLVTSALLAVPGTARAANVETASETPNSASIEEAATRFERGVRFYEEGDFGLALIEFERAHELVADYRVLYNIAQVSLQLGRFAKARLALERYLREGDRELSSERKLLVDKDLAMLRERTAHLLVRVAEPEATITVDEVPRGASPWTEPLLLDAGEHRVVVEKPGFEPYSTRLTLAGAEDRTLEARLSPRSAPKDEPRDVVPGLPRPVATEATPEATPFPWRTTTWIAAGVFAASATTTAILAFSEKSTLETLKNDPASSGALLEEQASKANTLFGVTDGLFVGAAALGALGLYLEWSHAGFDDVRGRPAPRAFRLTPNSVSLETAF